MEDHFKRLTGKYKLLSNSMLIEMRKQQITIFEQWGAHMPLLSSVKQETIPLWYEVEFWDLVIEFEVEKNPDLLTSLEE
jgi:hypothetical protein